MADRKDAKKSKVSSKECPNPNPSNLGNVIKSPMDPSEYKSIILPNGLKALLISTCRQGCPLANSPINPDTGIFIEIEKFNEKYLKVPANQECAKEPENKRCKCESENFSKNGDGDETNNLSQRGYGLASLHIAVGAGHFHNPEDFPGMAHLYEHCCIEFGSKKYPHSEDLLKNISNSNGLINAMTGAAITNYYFCVDLRIVGEDRFRQLVDMQADGIINPLLPSDAVYDEIHAVDSEFSMLEAADCVRIPALFYSMWPKGHPKTNFDCGTRETLAKPNLLEKMKEWKERHYVANNMAVVIQAAIPLEELEQIIRESFGQFPSSPAPKPSDLMLAQKWGKNVNSNFNKLYRMVPACNIQLAQIMWELPVKLTMNLDTKPLLYLREYLNREGEGTLIEHLKNRHWALSLTAYYWPQTDGGATFSSNSSFGMEICLTDSGLKEFDRVLLAVYAYIEMIASEIANEDLFAQIQLECADDFHYNETKRCNMDRYLQLSSNLLFVKDLKYILTTLSLVTEFDSDVLEEAVDLLTPKNMNVILVSKSFKGKCNQKEKWYNTEYSSCKFSPRLLKNLNNAKCDQFKPLRGVNPYRVENLICSLPRPQSEPTIQTLLENNKASVIYLKLDYCSDGNVPVGQYSITIGCPLIRKTQTSLAMMRIWLLILLARLSEVCQLPNHACINTFIDQYGTFFQLCLGGAAQHLTKVTKMILDVFMGFEKTIDEQTFLDYKTLLVNFINDSDVRSQKYAVAMLRFLQTDSNVLKEHLLKAANDVTFEQFMKLVKTYKERMYLSAVLIGCISEVNARTLSAYIELMEYRELPEEFPGNPASTPLQFPLGERCLRVKNPLPMDHTSAVINSYQFGLLEEEDGLLLEKLVQLMEFPLFFQLRTTEHLSYATIPFLWYNAGSMGLRIYVICQPHRHTTGYVDERIDAFLVNFRRYFACYDAIFASPCSPNGSLTEMTREEHQRLLVMYDDYLLPTGGNFRKLSVQVVGTPNPVKRCRPISENLKLIQDKIAMFPPFCFSFDLPCKHSIKYDTPDDLKVSDDNGYFVTNITTFRNSLSPFSLPHDPDTIDK